MGMNTCTKALSIDDLFAFVMISGGYLSFKKSTSVKDTPQCNAVNTGFKGSKDLSYRHADGAGVSYPIIALQGR
ncbi:hypothetical protein OUZ56_003923 [Daphnia magna]|uniref:Uncharacterized protein n=1 Tax=Daphnia magna TaxID=35525 RepID=A0ABQ9YNC0_9CRUS|nr:hypothetical protein OUZ56_003923 [Daphnia magna]